MPDVRITQGKIANVMFTPYLFMHYFKGSLHCKKVSIEIVDLEGFQRERKNLYQSNY